MDIPKTLTDKLAVLDQGRFESIKESEFRPSYDLMGLKYLRDKAGHEKTLKELYRNRAPYELLQNADDSRATQAVFVLTPEGLAFLHDGAWFSLQNFRSLADGWSDKAPDQCIGHKGLGFRSVLDITPSPFLVRVDPKNFFAVKFAWTLNKGHIDKAIRHDPSLRERYQEWSGHGRSACPIMAIPGLAKKQDMSAGARVYDDAITEKYGKSLTTMFWFPARDPDIDARALDDLSPIPIISDDEGRDRLTRFLEREVSVLLPFLACVGEVSVHDQANFLCSASITRSEERQGQVEVDTIVGGGELRSETFFQIRSSHLIPSDIRNQPDTPRAVREMKEASTVLSVRIKEGEPVPDDESCFHVYFPTEERTGVGLLVHGDFHVKPDRTRLMGGSYNKWLLGEAAKVAAGDLLTPRPIRQGLSPPSCSRGSSRSNSGGGRLPLSRRRRACLGTGMPSPRRARAERSFGKNTSRMSCRMC